MADLAGVSATATHGDPHHHPTSFWSKYVFATDHKIIAMQYMFTGMAHGA